MSNQSVVEPYQSSRLRANLLMGVLAFNIIVQVVAIVLIFRHIDLLYKIMEETTAVSRANLQGSEAREATMRIVQMVAFLLSAIVFLIWLHRAYKNLKPLGAEPPYSSTLAVLFFIIPVANLFLPFQILSRVWRESDPETVVASGAKPAYTFATEQSSKSLLVIIWWGVWLLVVINFVLAYRWQVSWQILNEEIIAAVFALILSLLLIIFSIVTAVLAKKMAARQDEKKQRLDELATPPESLLPSAQG